MFAIVNSLHTPRLVKMTGRECLVAWRIVIPSVAEGSREISPRALLGRDDINVNCHVEHCRDISYVISTKRSTWSARLCRLARPRNLSATNTFSNLLEMHAIYRNFSLFYLEVNKLFAIFATEKYGTGSLRFTLFLLDL